MRKNGLYTTTDSVLRNDRTEGKYLNTFPNQSYIQRRWGSHFDDQQAEFLESWQNYHSKEVRSENPQKAPRTAAFSSIIPQSKTTSSSLLDDSQMTTEPKRIIIRNSISSCLLTYPTHDQFFRASRQIPARGSLQQSNSLSERLSAQSEIICWLYT